MHALKSIYMLVVILLIFSCFGPFDPFDPAPLRGNESDTTVTENPGTTTSGLIARWKCDDTASNTFKDENGAHDGQRVGGTSDSGIDGRSLHLDGEGDFMYISNSDSVFDFDTGDFTLSVWVKPQVVNTEVDSLYPIFSIGELFEDGFSLLVKDGYFGALIGPYKSQTAMDSSAAVGSNSWHHVVMLRKNSTVELYVDARRVQSYDSDYTVATRLQLMIGRGYSQGLYSTVDHFFRGNIDEIKILNIGWSSSDVAAENGRFEH
jgi:hypothetical protein